MTGRGKMSYLSAPFPEGPTPAQARVAQLSGRVLSPSCAPAAWADVPQGRPRADGWYKHHTLISELFPRMHSAFRSPIKS